MLRCSKVLFTFDDRPRAYAIFIRSACLHDLYSPRRFFSQFLHSSDDVRAKRYCGNLPLFEYYQHMIESSPLGSSLLLRATYYATVLLYTLSYSILCKAPVLAPSRLPCISHAAGKKGRQDGQHVDPIKTSCDTGKQHNSLASQLLACLLLARQNISGHWCGVQNADRADTKPTRKTWRVWRCCEWNVYCVSLPYSMPN